MSATTSKTSPASAPASASASASEVVETAPAAPKLATFKLDDSQLALIGTRVRVAKVSEFYEEVKAAIGTSETYGIAIPEGTKASKIVSELHKAATALGIKIKVWNRETAATPFVGFSIKPGAVDSK